MNGYYINTRNAYGEYSANVGGYDMRIRDDPDRRGSVIYYATAGEWTSRERRATFRPCAWARRLHGNPPSGTKYGSFLLTLPDGTRRACAVYL